jgi:hypothetical protein
LVQALLKQLCQANQAQWPREITPDAMDWLTGQEWREANVRELRNMLERVVKDRKDSEILVRPDLESISEIPRQKVRPPVSVGPGIITYSLPEGRGLRDLIEYMNALQVPEEYEGLQGAFPALRESVAHLFGKALVAAIKATRKPRPNGSSEGDVNITGAASCLMGAQLSTAQACDLIKRIFQIDDTAREKLLSEFPTLREAYDKAIRLRSKKVSTP